VSSKKRSHRLEKLARIYDAEILPVWSQRFGQMLLRGLEIPPKSQILDVACSTGYPAIEIIRRMGDGSRLIALDSASVLLDVARKKVEKLGAKGVFFRTEGIEPKLSFADDVYDLVVCNLGLTEVANAPRALMEFARVTRPGGQVRATLPIEGTFQEFYDIFREVLTKNDKHDTLDRLTEHLKKDYKSPEMLENWMAASGLRDVRIEVEEFTMLFRSSREFFFAPVIEFGPLATWKEVAGSGQEMQDLFWYIKEAIDAYFEGRAFEVTVKAACLIGTKYEIGDEDETGQVMLVDIADIDPATNPTTQEIDLEEMVDTVDRVEAISDDELVEQVAGEIAEELAEELADDELDAFAEGAVRPDHLDEN
jgi:ubiquinone/menaquinone biosynthesis C-methylase UbiE